MDDEEEFKKDYKSGLNPKKTKESGDKLTREQRLKIMRDELNSQPDEWEDKFNRNKG